MVGEGGDVVVEQGLVDVEALGGGADLAGVEVGGPGAAAGGDLDVGGDVVLEVSVPRTPCRTFAARMGIGGWMKQFIAHGRCGIYLRVVTPGTITAGDPIVVDEASIAGHGIDMITAFAASAGHDDAAAARVVAARCLPAMYHDRLVRRLAVGDLTNSR